ncbi:unnamed protein product, partial [Choristocarpus tenellus]
MPDMRTCVDCLTVWSIDSASSTPNSDDVRCSSCCGTLQACEFKWSWGALVATLAVTAVFAGCTGIFALAERLRRQKGLSLARAWSIPQGIPVLRATVSDLSEAVRRGRTWSRDRGSSDEDPLERVGLLDNSCGEYGALGDQPWQNKNRDSSSLPVAKLAESGVHAVAWESPDYLSLLESDDLLYQVGSGLRSGRRGRVGPADGDGSLSSSSSRALRRLSGSSSVAPVRRFGVFSGGSIRGSSGRSMRLRARERLRQVQQGPEAQSSSVSEGQESE